MFDDTLLARATALVALCVKRSIALTTAESCTGGLLAALLTEVAGSSAVFGYGFVTYANAAKCTMLDVPTETLDRHGAVSSQTAEAMAQGALHRSGATLAVAITGIAGPGGGSAAKPVGLVHFGLARSGKACRLVERHFGDLGRATVRRRALDQALTLLEDGASL
ncbi:nicotinamide-nucleotide amidohydrolase family protein [Lichenihabitans sp. Uapishka_5]|uniref:CinA family protein n=1 Tax=Lichenihabitans sp. Uapishka_5 TaxID=3037302 RepID=UPI0029E7EC0C|nr:nicotinamide-nucleotide amidohydrolase family protein [Lichenihabitans sp. Uapishka_5]MDX7949852.1 nicotinamide-nucleotide amidohydrolase family protein [Lichenihabitans sp. Uapishka_5]